MISVNQNIVSISRKLEKYFNKNKILKKEIILAFPRNPLHVRFISQNLKSYDLIIYRERFMEKYLQEQKIRNAIYIGREFVPEILNFIKNPFKVRAYNEAYYKIILTKIIRLKIKKFIIFLENEPAESFFINNINNSKIELWEEGVMHYLPTYNNMFWFVRKVGQLFYGFYPKNIFRKRIDRKKFLIKDRFIKKNLKLNSSIPFKKKKKINKCAYIGNAFADDNVLSIKKLSNILIQISKKINTSIVYFPHPRESKKSINNLKKYLVNSNIKIYNDKLSTLNHFKKNTYLYYFSGISSTILEIDEPKKCYWIPYLIGFKKLHNSLTSTKIFPVKTIKKISEIKTNV
jgi:hypothetical protein